MHLVRGDVPATLGQVVAQPCNNCGADASAHWALATDIEYCTSERTWEYRRCSACGVIYLADPPVDRLSEIYPPNYYSYAISGRGSVLQKTKSALDRRQLKRFLAPLPAERVRLADIGGGVGALASSARAADRRVVDSIVVDLDPGCSDAAVAAGHRYVTGAVDDIEIGEVDAILLFNLIEHVHHPVATLERLAASLSPNGRMLVKTPNTDSLDARLFRNRSWGGYHCPRHWVLFDPDSFTATAARAGLRVENLELTQGAPFWAVSCFGVMEARGLVRRRAGQAIHQHPAYAALLAGAAAFDLARRPFSPTSQMFVTLSR
jgi:2-polyprenyl-3-methyl-5-hydroxy-6-metoxy-1,4-benzoquinol methylase